MASDLNKAIMIGRMTRDGDLKDAGGSSVVSFSIAVNRSWSKDGEKKEQVAFVNCVAWGKMAELICKYAHKGDRVMIEGRIQTRSWEGQDGRKNYVTEVFTENAQFLQGKKEGGESYPSSPPPPPDDGNPFDDQEIPF